MTGGLAVLLAVALVLAEVEAVGPVSAVASGLPVDLPAVPASRLLAVAGFSLAWPDPASMPVSAGVAAAPAAGPGWPPVPVAVEPVRLAAGCSVATLADALVAWEAAGVLDAETAGAVAVSAVTGGVAELGVWTLGVLAKPAAPAALELGACAVVVAAAGVPVPAAATRAFDAISPTNSGPP